MNEAGWDISAMRVIADYQFGKGAGEALFPSDEPISITRSRTGRPRQLLSSDDTRISSFTTLGRFTLGIEGGKRLLTAFDPPRYFVVVGEESAPYIKAGRNAFAKFVLAVDPSVRPGDEVIVVSESYSLLGVGRAELSAGGMQDFSTGMAVKVKEGNETTMC